MSKLKNLKYLSLPLIGGTILVGSIYGGASLSNHSQSISLRNETKPQTLGEAGITLVNGGLSSDSVTDASGKYILPAKNKSGKAAVAKLNQSGSYLYSWEFNEANYEVDQIVKDTDDEGYYYVLLVNKTDFNVTGVSSAATLSSAQLTSPAKVVQIFDDGSSFKTNNTYVLQLPTFKNGAIGLLNFWEDVYIEKAPTAQTENSKFNFIKTSSSSGSGSGSNTKLERKLIYQNWSAETSSNGQATRATGEEPVLKSLYLNNAKNMVYISHKEDNVTHKMLLLFGGSEAQSFWFYDFEVFTKPEGTRDVNGRLYSDYSFMPNKASDNYRELGGSTQLLKNGSGFILNKLKTTNRAEPAWFIGGAKTISLYNEGSSTSPYILVGMLEPNYANANGTGNLTDGNGHDQIQQSPESFNKILVGSSSINSTPYPATGANTDIDKGNNMEKWNRGTYRSRMLWSVMTAQTAWRVASTNAGEYSETTAWNLTGSTNSANELFDTSNLARTELSTPSAWTANNAIDNQTGLSLTIGRPDPNADTNFTSANGDGWKNSVSQKLISFNPGVVTRFNKENNIKHEQMATLMLVRGSVGLAFYNFKQNIPTVDIAKDVIWNTLSYDDKTLDFTNVKSISYSDNTWFLNYQAPAAIAARANEATDAIYALSYGGDTGGIPLVTFSKTSIKASAGERISSIQPISSSAIYVITEKKSGSDQSQKVELWTKPMGGLPTDYTNNKNYVPNATSYKENKSIWGDLSEIPYNQLVESGIINRPSTEILNDPTLLEGMIQYTPGWVGQSNPLIINPQINGETLTFDVALQHPNGRFYTSAVDFDKNYYKNVYTDADLGIKQFKYEGFGALPVWVLPTAIGGSFAIVIIFVTMGLVFGIPMRATRKLQEKGFTSTFKKVDNLTSAVGSVYKKIATIETKKAPQMLKAASAGKPGAPKAPGATAAVKPGAPRPAGATAAVRPGAPKPPGATAAVKPGAPRPAAPKPQGAPAPK